MAVASRFEQVLLARFAAALGISIALSHAAGCGGKVVLEPDSTGSGGGGGASSSSSNVSSSGTTTTTAASSSSGFVPCDTSLGDPFGTQLCFGNVPNGCPDAASAAPLIAGALDPCTCLMSVDGGPYIDATGSCCYDATLVSTCVIGRPYTVEREIITAQARPGSTAFNGQFPMPQVSDLPSSVRRALAKRWCRDALLEHASIASFARFSMALMAAGAPAHLIEGAHQAALDEIRHAKLSFALAAAYGGEEPLGPSPMPLGTQVNISGDLCKIAAEAALEGCVGETLASLLAAEQAAHAQDPALKQALSAIAEDEAQHAELAWKTIAWAIEAGGEPVKAAVQQAFAEAAKQMPTPPEELEGPAHLLQAHGELEHGDAFKLLAQGLFRVVLPCAGALLSSKNAHHPRHALS